VREQCRLAVAVECRQSVPEVGVCPKVTSKIPKIATFRNWLLTEAAETLAG
jgi:hypothetical protein